jgi:transcriptional regulator with XRE-family HTH domain
LVRRIVDERRRHQVAWADLGARAGVSVTTMHNWRTGRQRPKLDELEAVLNVLDLKLVVRSASVGE